MADWPDRFQPPPGPGEPRENAEMPPPVFEPPAPATQVEEVMRRHGPALLAVDGVEGIAAGRSPAGAPALIVFVRDSDVQDRLPTELDGVPVQSVITGPIEAQ